jgi:hypothetical protein
LPTQNSNELIDELEARMIEYPLIECPLRHTFINGMYIREIFMPAGSLITSKIHLTRHRYFVSRGTLYVQLNGVWEKIEAPYEGITEPGTRRVLFIVSDTVWTTFHLTELKDVDAIEEIIIGKHDNPLLTEAQKKAANNIHRYGLEGYESQLLT